MTELNAEDRYQVRKLQMDVDKRSLDVQKAQQDLDRFLLEMGHKYGILDRGTSIDPKTGTIKAAVPARNGEARTGALQIPELGEAAA
jgi:hypothetical protein